MKKTYYFPNPEIADVFFGLFEPVCVDLTEIERITNDWGEPTVFSHCHVATEEELERYGHMDSVYPQTTEE